MSSTVTLRIYDLSMGMAAQMSESLLGKKIDYIPHTGIVVYGKEYFFGGGIQSMPPIQVEQTFGLRPVKVITLGTTQISEQTFHNFLAQISSRFTPETYDLFTNNCNNFSNEASNFLLGTGIPADIINLPQEFLNTPMGQMLRPMLQTTQDQLNNRFEQQGNRMTFNNSNNNTNNNAGSAIANTPTSSMPSTNTDNNVTNNNLKSEESTFVKPDFNSQELMTITIKASGESKPIQVQVPIDGNVGDLMNVIQYELKCHKDLQRLIFLGKVLKTETDTLVSLNITAGKTILLSRRSASNNNNSSGSSGSVSTTRSSNSSGAMGSSTNSSTPGTVTMATAIQSLRTAPKQEALTAIATLVKITDKIISNPNEAKYRSIKKNNEMLKRKLGTVNGGIECLLALGFQDSEDGESFRIVPSASAWNVLTQGKEQLLKLKNNLENPPSSTTPSPNFFGGAQSGMPDMGNVLQAAMQNPAMLQGMMSNPMVQQMMQSNPMMAQQAQMMMQNPQMLSNALSMMQQNPQMMQQMMSQMGGTGSPGGMPGMDMNAMGQMLGGMNFNNQATTTQQPQQTNTNNTTSSTATDAEAEELAAAIARSLREQ